ncbi:MAG TPA: divergent polysaccharide deacetylase family protein [Rhodospirillales bacterium]|nr:divergent polysaccharide deacetylase family protein [Rhodospirillales bacterium]
METAPLEPIEPAPIAAPEPEAKPVLPPAWRRFAVAAPQIGDRPRIALVIDDMGVDQKRSAMIIGLKAPLTLSFLTYADNLKAQTKAARDAGHELLLHVAMEPGSNDVDPGPNVLLTEHDEKELLRRLRWGLSRFDSYVGVNNHMGSKFTTNEPAMTVVLQELKRRGVLFLDSRTTGGSVGGKLAKRLGVPYAVRNIFLDNVNDEAAVYARLAEVERLARANGYAIAIGHPRDATIKILPRWIKEIEALGFVLTPLSSVINDPDNS